MFKFKLALLVALFVILAVAIPTVQASSAHPTWMAPYELAQQGLPSTIAGYKVLTVLTPDNTACMPLGEKRLVLQATQQSVQDFLRAINYATIKADLELKGMAEYTKWSAAIVGPGTGLQDLLSENEKWNQERQKSGCTKSKPAGTGSDYQEFKARGNGYAIFEDTDAGSFTDDNAQSVYLESEGAIANRTGAVIFLNNVKTDNSTFYLLQNGLEFWHGVGRAVWTDTTHGYVNQAYNFAYYGGYHIYWFTITYSGGVWFMCGDDNSNPSTYECHSEPNGVGTTLALDINTSVFVENQNTDPNWYQGFSSPFWAYGATIYRNGNPYSWSTQHHHTEDNCAQNYDPHKALGGTLIGGYGAGWFPAYIPLLCP